MGPAGLVRQGHQHQLDRQLQHDPHRCGRDVQERARADQRARRADQHPSAAAYDGQIGQVGTPMMFGMPQEARDSLAAGVPFPSRLGTPADYAKLVKHIVENEMLNGEVIRLRWGDSAGVIVSQFQRLSCAVFHRLTLGGAVRT
jgi:hypothetical protein